MFWRSVAPSCVLLAVLSSAPPAEAVFHLVEIEEIMAGANGDATVQFVEIRICCTGQNNQGGNARLVFFDAGGTQIGQFLFPGNSLANAAKPSILVATQGYADQIGVPAPDFIMPALMATNSGKVCYKNTTPSIFPFTANQCLSYGNFTGSTEGFGSPAAALTVTGLQSLRRIADILPPNNAQEFALGTPTPCNSAGVCRTLSGGNSVPEADAQSVQTPEDTAVSITLTGSDPDGGPLTFTVLTLPADGVLTGTPPNVVFTPDPDFQGADSFTFKVSDGSSDSNTAAVSITVTPINDPATADIQSQLTPEDTSVAITLTGSDPEGDPLTFTILTNPTHGVLTGTPPDLVFSPEPNFNGSDGFSFLVIDRSTDTIQENLIAQGAALFFNETFNGNGRTCGTCHPAGNNFTLDPAFIASLPQEDPLFVAETNTALSELENPILMRRFGLILENVDGFDQPGVMRGVPHTLAMSTSVRSFAGFRTGWSGDGSPGDGSLRSFATGAVIQHFTKTLNRVPGTDFRLPTAAELDAIEAFTLSLGRPRDLSLPLPLKGEAAARGQAIFLDNSLGRCNLCHGNAGARATLGAGNLGNLTFNTGVEILPNHPARPTGEPMPPDGGFGKNPRVEGGFGDGSFDTPPLVEAADTGPFFHNNAVQTIEEAVDFYNGPEFNNSPSAQEIGGGINLDQIQTVEVAAFLRVINALENIRSAIQFFKSALLAEETGPVPALLNLASEDIADAIFVLEGGGLHSDAVVILEEAESLTDEGRIPEALLKAKEARKFLVDDAGLDSDTATVSMTVTPVNDPPTADSQSVLTPEDTPVAITLTGSDPEGDPLTFTILSNPFQGGLSGTPPNLVYAPDPNFHGSVSFTFRARDGRLNSNTATVSIIVTPVDKSPDLDGSGRVDGFDLGRMGMDFGTRPGDPNWNPDADLNRDDVVDEADLNILRSSFGETMP